MMSAPSRRRFFIREANTGWASVGFAPMSSTTSADSTDLKSWVPADVPKAWERPKPVGEWQTRAQVSTLLLPNAMRIIFWTANTSSLVVRDEVMPPMAPRPCLAWISRRRRAVYWMASSHETTCHSSSMDSRIIGSSWRS